MHLRGTTGTLRILPILLALFSLFHQSIAARSKPEKALLSNIRTLTLRKDVKTSHNRVSAIPQLKCVGGTAKGLYEIDTLRCKNAGAGYSDDDVQWTCTANLPTEFKLGSTDVICEGFAHPNDPYVLKGSCGVEYRLMLTDVGEQTYGRAASGKTQFWDWQPDAQRNKKSDTVAVLFWLIFVGVVAWMLYAAFIRDAVPRRPRGGGFGGWGGGGGGGGNDDPPPPYEYHPPPPKPKRTTTSRTAGSRGAQAQQGPGFWTGALGGALAGAATTYLAGNRGARTEPQQPRYQNQWGNGEGSSRMGGMGRSGSSGSSSSPSYGSSTHESSGFGGTTRR